ncbi:MAG TPA: hypothetical protein VKU38_13635 [Ktedonobacteraceae bacterium]|nr:hypothetical protein [Ktedonobacteraceae bacterium]
MHNFERGEGELLPEDDAVEIVDLEPPEEIGASSSFWSASRFLAWQRSWNRRRFRQVTTLSMLVLITSVLLFSMHGALPFLDNLGGNNVAPPLANMSLLANNPVPVPLHIKPSLELLPQKNGITCLFDSAWSPNGAYIAFLGYEKDCVYGSHVYERGLVSIYNGTSGKLVRLFSPDNTIFQLLHSQFPTIRVALDIYYGSILWSPDEQHIALTFSLGLPTRASLPTGNIVGVALVDTGSGHVQVMLSRRANDGLSVEWDLQKQQAMAQTVIPSLMPSLNTGTNIPDIPAFAYHWGQNGALVPDFIRGHYLHIPRSKVGKSQIGRIGNPDGDSSFTIWQPGIGMLTTQDSMGSTYAPGIFTWNTNFTAWSPDERYLITSINLQGILQLPDHPLPTWQTLAKFHMDHVSYFPLRDVALQNLLLALNSATFNVVVAWQPAGYVLAAYDYGMIDLDMYDSVTGFEVALLALPDELRTDLSGTTMLRWSPDGSHLLLFDPELSTVTIWNVSKVS